ncbi:Outer membrane lipoprotein omp16 homolog precursor [Bartonella clarridgeiae 73]|uniref:Peptidoglycan-associated lipoprotein n=1 Tax=Bartonella clarridgeiae (strain CCUG 45776 / CIP 104772 / 73) TaxID=696125 RepID=E6YJ52_BARC7|nr:peptidoglycan-associated lipoprotein Pal [Bartonella clarridgeiae]WCR55872.1 MAG: Tol-Pal system peptidoglycan-associated lipoprotein PAL [Bartonella clarridgeiae]CBI76890.1 Outer membrane lipoprotein omp16 homolog precursor [Bartonella clarridgeiae 73]
MNSLRNIIRYPLVVVFCVLLALVGCGKKNIDATNRMNSSLNGSGLNNVQAGSSQDFTVNVGDRVFFSLNSSSIELDAEYILARQAEWLLRYPHYFVTIEGHADERGTREYNLALGQRRAVAVRDHLISLGVSSQRMKTISYGKERPVALCDDISCWNQNRRAVLVVNTMGNN